MSDKKRALITGITGQDGHYLTELLLEKGYEVHGFARRGSRLPKGVQSHVGDLQDPAALRRAIVEAWPHEIYNLGAQSHVQASFLDPEYTFRVTALPLFTILEQVKDGRRECRVYQASSSEMFGDAPPPQNESSPFRPRSPYAVAKVAAHHAVHLYREAKYKLFVVGGILMNHESPIRPTSFVTRKITSTVAAIFRGEAKELVLGNLDVKRDWGFAGDYVKAMYLMLQQDAPKDYVIATGDTHSVREFAVEAFRVASELTGRSLDWQDYVKTNPRFERPAEVPLLLGNATRACQELGWAPEVNFSGLVRMMVEADLSQRDLNGP